MLDQRAKPIENHFDDFSASAGRGRTERALSPIDLTLNDKALPIHLKAPTMNTRKAVSCDVLWDRQGLRLAIWMCGKASIGYKALHDKGRASRAQYALKVLGPAGVASNKS